MFKQGCVAVPTYLKQRCEDKHHIIRETQPKIIFNTGEKMNILSSCVELNHETLVVNDSYSKLNEQNIEPYDLATILYTSGTSGKPKGVMLTHSNIVSNIEAIDKRFSDGICTIDEHDKCVSFLPMNHCYGLVCEFLYMTMKGSSMYINKNLLQLKSDFVSYNPTVLCAVPRLFQMIHNKMPIQNSTYLSFAGRRVSNFLKSQVFGKNLRHATCGGAPIDKELLRYFYTMDLPIYQGYGTTETSPMATLNSGTSNSYGSVGKVLDGVKIKLSETNEIMISGPNVSSGYFGHRSNSFVRENETNWYLTGDIGHFENDYLYIDGRESNTYKLANGKFVNPEEIEGILCRIPYISQCMVFTPDGISNMAIIVSNESENKIRQSVEKLKSHIKGYEFPTKFIIVKEPFNQDLLTQKQSLKRKLVLKEYEKLL
jgi:long-chain acyl-CoA synthetase